MQRASLFDIPRKPKHLASANEGVANGQYRQVTATKDVTGNQFSQGVQQFRFDTSGNTWFVPSMCYFRLRCSLRQVRVNGGQSLPILSRSDLAPNVGLASNLFKSVEVQLNGHTLERISERMPQIDALKTRMSNTGGWLNQLGKTTNFWDASMATRRQMIAADGYRCDDSQYGRTLTQEQAGFHANHLFLYEHTSMLFGCDENGQDLVDFRHGAMALRPGDRVIHQQAVLEILEVLSARTALATYVKAAPNLGRRSINDGADPAGGVNDWHFQKISQTQNNQACGKNEFEIIWRPPLGFFDIEHAIPPGGQWMFEFNPANALDCRKNAIESFLTDLDVVRDPSIAGQFDFRVEDFFFYMYTVESNRFDHGDWYLDLQHTRCQLQNMPANATSLVQKNFDVPGKTSHLTLAFQDQAEGSDTRYSSSKFKIRPAVTDDPNVSSHEGQDLNLERFFITYGNQQKPAPDFDGRYAGAQGNVNAPHTNFLQHRYVDSLMQADLFHTDGGPESFAQWVERGPYYHFRWPKDAMESSTRVTVSFKFSRPFDDALQHQVMLFSQWRSAYKISHKDGRITVELLREQ